MYHIIRGGDAEQLQVEAEGHLTGVQVQRAIPRRHRYVQVQHILLRNFVLLMARHPIPVPRRNNKLLHF